MRGDPYRTPAAVASRERVEADEAIAGHDLALGPLAPLFLPRELRERVAVLRDADGDDARIELAERLGEAVDVARQRQAELRALPDEHWSPAPLDDRWGPTGMENAAPDVVAEVRQLVSDVDRDVEVSLLGPRITARFRSGGCPITWVIDLYAAGGGIMGMHAGTERVLLTHSHVKMGVLLSDDAPLLKIRPETLGDAALKAVHLRKEVDIDDAAFDPAFFVEGTPAFARAMLTEPLRAALFERADAGDFAFWLEGSVVELQWTGGLVAGLATPRAFRGSVDVLIAARRAFSALELVRG